MREFFSNRNYRPIFYAFGAYLALTVGALMLTRQDDNVLAVARTLAPFCALTATLTAVWIRFIARHAENTPTIWNRMILGLVFWTIAEFIWFGYFLQGAGSGPFPGVADIFWLAAYVPFIEALSLRYQNFLNRTAKSRFTSFLFFMLALGIPLTYILTIPTVVVWKNLQQTLVYYTQIGYLLADLALLPFAILILVTLGRGRLFKVWGLIALAFILHALTQFGLSYLTRNSALVGRYAAIPTILFSLDHLILATGIYGNWLLGQQVALVSQLKLGFIGKEKEIPQFLINTDVEGKIINLSRNFLQFTNNSLPERYLGKSIQDALNLTAREFSEITTTCARGGFIVNYDIKVAAGQKAPVPLLLTAIGSLTPHDYFGMDIALQLPYYSAQAYPLDAESNPIVQEILRRTGQQTQESSTLLAEYFMTHLRSFYELVNVSQGSHTVAAMSSQINAAATKNNWPIRVNAQEVTIEPGFSNFDNAELLKALPVLFQIARQYTVEATNLKTVNEEIDRIDHEFGKSILQTAKFFGLRQS
jgi:hypothetical protein